MASNKGFLCFELLTSTSIYETHSLATKLPYYLTSKNIVIEVLRTIPPSLVDPKSNCEGFYPRPTQARAKRTRWMKFAWREIWGNPS